MEQLGITRDTENGKSSLRPAPIVQMNSATSIDSRDSVPSSGRIFVLGAGASAFAGYPLASGLLGFIRSFGVLDATTKEIASKVLDKLNQAEFFFKRNVIRDPNRVLNLEELLTYLELYRSFPGTPFAINPWDETDSSGVRRLITEHFLNYQYELNKVMSEANGDEVLQ